MLLVGRQEGHPAYKKTEWWGAGMVICLERRADLHMASLDSGTFLTEDIKFVHFTVCVKGSAVSIVVSLS